VRILVQRKRLRIAGLAALAAAGFAACVYPTDRSGELEVQMTTLPTLFLKDSVQLEARVVDADGNELENAVVEFTSDDPTILAVSPDGLVLAVAVGSATVSATAVEYAGTAPVTQAAQVRGLLEVDSVRPMTAKFGELVEIYGVGLDTNDLFSVSFGGVDAEIFAFQAADEENPQEFGRLWVWMPPPAPRESELTILGFNGGLVFPDTLTVQQRDIYEPNDDAPWHLGEIPLLWGNPAVAFEVRPRDETKQPADWYTFDNATTLDRTIVVFSEVVGAETFSVFLTDSLAWTGTPGNPWAVGPDSWTIGPRTYLCSGLPITVGNTEFQLEELPFPFTLVALKDLPAGRYHILAPYNPQGDPARYEMLIISSYQSVLSPDLAEENDYCDVAPPLSIAQGRTLSIDNFRDIDWYRFSIAAATGDQSMDITTTAVDPDADLDVYVVRADSAGGDLVDLELIQFNAASGVDESLLIDRIAPGNYYLIVMDFPGVPTLYTLDVTFGPPRSPPNAVAPFGASVLDALAAKRARAQTEQGSRAGLMKLLERLK
jgi:hypothetical protein